VPDSRATVYNLRSPFLWTARLCGRGSCQAGMKWRAFTPIAPETAGFVSTIHDLDSWIVSEE